MSESREEVDRIGRNKGRTGREEMRKAKETSREQGYAINSLIHQLEIRRLCLNDFD